MQPPLVAVTSILVALVVATGESHPLGIQSPARHGYQDNDHVSLFMN